MMSLQNISKQFGEKPLFQNLSLHIGKGDRIALVGPNGAGKSTLMKIIVNQIEADSGTITRSRFTTAGYLPQDGVYHSGQTLYEEVLTVFNDLNHLYQRMKEISDEIRTLSEDGETDAPEIEEMVNELGKIQQVIEHEDGYTIETRVKQILFGLGFDENDLNRMTEEFSGGWQMRIELAKLLLKEPSTLLLDEPTNHLDLESLQWLESYLQSYSGSLLLVSHDSRFLDNLVTKIVEFSMGRSASYTGNYSSYLKQKETRQEQLKAAYEQQQKFIERTTKFVERFRYKNTKAKQVQSRVKMLEKMDRIEIDHDDKTISFRFPQTARPGRVIMELDKMTKSYGSIMVFGGISLSIDRGDRIALLGVNGSGKSTMARIIAGVEPFQGGQRKPGHNVSISYFEQNLAESLDPEKSVLETLETVAAGASPRELRTLLGSFLFSGDDVFKPVSVLSGGEKSRLALAKMLLIPANFLIFDEPTNHLDAKSKHVLQESLKKFTGSYMIVSHDRDFLAPLINKVVSIRSGYLDIFPGTVDEYTTRTMQEEEGIQSIQHNAANKSSAQLDRERKRHEAELRRTRYQKLKPLKDARHAIEEQIHRAEERKTEIEAAFADQNTYGDDKKIQSLHIEHDQIRLLLDDLYNEWAGIEDTIETITGELE